MDGMDTLSFRPATHADIVPDEGSPVEVWGVVTTVIKSLMPR